MSNKDLLEINVATSGGTNTAMLAARPATQENWSRDNIHTHNNSSAVIRKNSYGMNMQM